MNMKNIYIFIVVAVVLAIGYTAFKGYGQGSVKSVPVVQTTTNGNVVQVTQSGFEPKTITIKAGETVVWKNIDGGEVSINSAVHPTHLVYPPLNLGTLSQGSEVSLKFDTAGRYSYHNHLNPSETGEVIVQ